MFTIVATVFAGVKIILIKQGELDEEKQAIMG